MTVGATLLTSNGARDIYVVKYNPAGVVQWAKSFGTPTDDFAIGVVADSAGHVTFDGYFAGSITIGSTVLTSHGNNDILVAQLNQSDGSVVWAKNFGESASDQGMGIGADSGNNLYLSGYIGVDSGTGVGVVTFAPCPAITNNGPSFNVFVAKLTNAGSCVWAQAFQSTGFSRANHTAVDAAGDVAITGWFNNTLNLGGSNLVAANGLVDIFVAKYTAAGTHVWSKRVGDPAANDFGYGITLDGSGNVVVVGTVQGTVDFGGGATPPTGANSSDGYVVQYASATGGFNWVHRLAGTNSDEAFTVTTDAANNVLVGGYFSSPSLAWGGTPLVGLNGTQYAYLLKYTPAGGATWGKVYLDNSTGAVGKGVTVTTLNRPVLGGYFFGSMTTPDGLPLTAVAGSDSFVSATTP